MVIKKPLQQKLQGKNSGGPDADETPLSLSAQAGQSNADIIGQHPDFAAQRNRRDPRVLHCIST